MKVRVEGGMGFFVCLCGIFCLQDDRLSREVGESCCLATAILHYFLQLNCLLRCGFGFFSFPQFMSLFLLGNAITEQFLSAVKMLTTFEMNYLVALYCYQVRG